ncbi:MAG: DUF3164 family protein [Bacteroidales bacterium]
MNELELTQQQKEAIYEEMKAKEAEQEQQKAQERKVYKEMVNDAVIGAFPLLEELSGELSSLKKRIYGEFRAILEMKHNLYKVKSDTSRHNFMSKDGQIRVILGSHVTDGYDDTVNEGIQKVKDYLSSLATSAETKMLINAITKLISRDNAGNLKASKVLQLQQMADESGNSDFLDGVRIIRESYNPQVSKQFVRAEKKNELGEWVSVPLGMTEA